MRIFILILILLFSPFSGVNSQNNLIPPQDEDSGNGFDEDPLLLQADIFSQKKFQKRLKSMSNKDKVIWAFKLSERDIFL
ncbi:MAG: hypothetical protein ABFR75_08335 [Acidobacteriota bacterium]